ncbi:MAG: hypothetical protein ACRD2L_02960 [Terriglobia bacterium]
MEYLKTIEEKFAEVKKQTTTGMLCYTWRGKLVAGSRTLHYSDWQPEIVSSCLMLDAETLWFKSKW